MKRIIPIFAILAILGFFIFLALTPPTVSGVTYLVKGNDTTIIGNVEILLTITEINNPVAERDTPYKSFTFSSDDSGQFTYEVWYVPVIADYELIYSKQGIGTLTYRTTLRRTRNMNFSAHLLEKPNRETSLFVGQFDHSINYIDFNPNFMMWGFTFLMIMIYLSYRFKLYVFLKDKVIGARSRKFIQWKSSKQNEVLNSVFCENCKTEREMKYDSEQNIKGMIFIHGTCKVCNRALKKRIK